MKTMMTTLLLSAFLLACASPKNNEADRAVTTTEQTQPDLISNYVALKDALVQSNADLAKAAAKTLSVSLKDQKMNSEIIDMTNQIAASNDLSGQRKAFKEVTSKLIAELKAKGTSQGIFVQFCPMAFGGEGGSWLSLSEEIRNPYYGDMMLKCGRVTEKL